MSKKLGSEIFGTTEIRTDEFLILAKCCRDNGETIEETALTIEAFDDLLSLRKVQSIIGASRTTAKGTFRKGSSFYDFMDRRIDKLTEDLKFSNKI